MAEGIVNLGKALEDAKADSIKAIGTDAVRWCYHYVGFGCDGTNYEGGTSVQNRANHEVEIYTFPIALIIFYHELKN